MKIHFTVGLLFLTILSVSAQDAKLERKVLLEGYIALGLPNNLEPMSEEDKSIRYRKAKMPIFALSNEYSDVFFSMNKPTESADESAIPKYLDYYSNIFSTFYISAEVLNSEIRTVNGKQVGCIELTHIDIVEDVYHCFFFTNLEGKLLTFSLIAPKEEKDEWTKTAMKIVESLEVK